jgi:hypothetical protein
MLALSCQQKLKNICEPSLGDGAHSVAGGGAAGELRSVSLLWPMMQPWIPTEECLIPMVFIRTLGFKR